MFGLRSEMPKTANRPPNTKCEPQDPQYVTNDTASDDPLLMKARIFSGCLNKENCTREDIIELFSMYGPLRGVSHFVPAGFAYVQFENVEDANTAVQNLNNYIFHGRKMVVKIADPTMQKPLKQGAQGAPNPKFQQKSKPFGTRQDNSAKQSFGAFGQTPQRGRGNSGQQRPFQKGQKSQRGKFGQYQGESKFASASNAIPLGSKRNQPDTFSNVRGRGGFKNKNSMPRQQPKKPRFSNEYQNTYSQVEYTDQDPSYYDQYNNYEESSAAQYGEYSSGAPTDSNAETGYQAFENPYGEIGYSVQEGEYIEGQYPEGQYAQEEYGEYTEEQLADYYAQYGYEYNPNEVYYDEFGQPIEYSAEDYADYYGQESGDQQYDQDYLASLPRHNSPKNAPNLGPPSKSRKAEFVSAAKPVQKATKIPQVVKELEDRPIHYNYEIPDFFVCGGCHFATANPQYFIQHRSQPCKIKQVSRGEDEPAFLQCNMCSENVKNSWDLVAHMGRKHCLYLFNETHLAGGNTD